MKNHFDRVTSEVDDVNRGADIGTNFVNNIEEWVLIDATTLAKVMWSQIKAIKEEVQQKGRMKKQKLTAIIFDESSIEDKDEDYCNSPVSYDDWSNLTIGHVDEA